MMTCGCGASFGGKNPQAAYDQHQVDAHGGTADSAKEEAAQYLKLADAELAARQEVEKQLDELQAEHVKAIKLLERAKDAMRGSGARKLSLPAVQSLAKDISTFLG